MYFMYVDESGDPGMYDTTKPARHRASRHYIVSGVAIPADEWRNYLTAYYNFRRFVKGSFGLPAHEELHGAELIQRRVPTKYKVIGPRKRRVMLYRQALENFCSLMPKARVFNAHLDKQNPAYPYTPTPEGIQTLVWGRMLERYNRFLRLNCGGDMGMIFADETDEVRIRKLVRKMRVFNYAGSHFGGGYADPLVHLIEDPVMRRSENSYFIQISDLISHALYRKLYPKGSLRTFNVDLLFDAVKPCLHLPASHKDPHKMGIVHC